MYIKVSLDFNNYSAHSVLGHSSVLDSGFRRNDESKQAFFTKSTGGSRRVPLSRSFLWLC